MIQCQRDLFSLPEEVSYINCAYMAPLMKKVIEEGKKGVEVKALPFEVKPNDFFEPANAVRTLFAKLIQANDPERVAIIPSVSYGIANVVKNIKAKSGQNIVLLEEQFPSNYYSWKRLADEKGLEIRIAKPSRDILNRAASWNENILQLIDENTVAVAMPIVHWADGTKFDLKPIRIKTKQMDAKLIIDGTQSIGAMPFDFNEIQPDALICVSYKWLLGPYSIGLAYYGEAFDDGIPIEESWMSRENSEDFRGLVDYEDNYRDKAFKYNVGEFTSFIRMPMVKSALETILGWGIQNIQDYCAELTGKYLNQFEDMGCVIEDPTFRGHHLFGIRLNDNFDFEKLNKAFVENKVFVSFRGSAIRIAPNVYNNEKDFEKLVNCFRKAIKPAFV